MVIQTYLIFFICFWFRYISYFNYIISKKYIYIRIVGYHHHIHHITHQGEL